MTLLFQTVLFLDPHTFQKEKRPETHLLPHGADTILGVGFSVSPASQP